MIRSVAVALLGAIATGALEAVAFSAKDDGISCIAQIAVKLQRQQ